MRRFSASAARSVVGGCVFGMSRKLVTPPQSAANDSVASVALCVRPGSRQCTWSSMRPGRRCLPLKIDRRRAGGHRARADTLDAIVADQDVGRDDAPFVDDLGIGQQ